MSLTNDELLQRIELIEEALNRVLQALPNYATLEQLRQLNTIRQAELDSIDTRLTNLQAQVDLLKSEIFK